MKTRLLILGLALCMIAAPARADLFGFHLGNLQFTWDGVSTFTSQDWASTAGTLYRNTAPAGTAEFEAGSWGAGLEDFMVSMTISSLTGVSAVGTGTWWLKDIDGDTLGGNISGNWANFGGNAMFLGVLGNVTYVPANNTFDGHDGDAVSLVFGGAGQPWSGWVTELTVQGAWFVSGQAYGTTPLVQGGSVDAGVVPVPAAVLLGLLGLGAAGLKLRRFA
jgi:hypothetical protein